jgi:hypothetical protein
MNITTFDRDMTREQWTQVWRIMRKVGEDQRDLTWLEERADIARVIAKYEREGQVCLVESGMDCDCVSYCHSRNVSGLTVMGFVKRRDDMYEWADGPCNLSICAPEDAPESFSRDLALEAYEDGHPHVVYA